jgi:hypothetical protein
MKILPRITFGVIVLNGEPFIRYNLRALYPFAHQIIVVEGATPAAVAIATPDGHSTDRTLQNLRKFKANEDPENKIIIVTAEKEGHKNGFWPGEKHEMSQAYATRATGDYLWQIDVDEFYKSEDMETVVKMLTRYPEITAMSFKMITFWGGFDHIADGWYLRRGANIYHRLFKWGKGYLYKSHRPPTVINPQGTDLRQLNWIHGSHLARRGILLYHYSLVFPKQVVEKCEYYQQAQWAKRSKAVTWAKDVYYDLKNPYKVHNVYDYPSWLERFRGTHPKPIKKLIDDIATQRIGVEIRPVQDREELLGSNGYKVGRFLMKIADYTDRLRYKISNIGSRYVRYVLLLLIDIVKRTRDSRT